jgi:hypothetical protein
MTIPTISSLRATNRRLAKRVGWVEKAEAVLAQMRAGAACTCSIHHRARNGR